MLVFAYPDGDIHDTVQLCFMPNESGVYETVSIGQGFFTGENPFKAREKESPIE